MKSKNALLTIAFVLMFVLVACGGDDATVQSATLAAPIYKNVEQTVEVSLFDRVIFDIEGVSGEIVISDGQKSHTITVVTANKVEKTETNSKTVFTLVNYDGLQVCFIERIGDRMNSAFQNYVPGVTCDVNYLKLEAEGKWDIISNTSGIEYEQDYNVRITLPRNMKDENIPVFNEEGNQDQISIKLISVSRHDDAEITTAIVHHADAVICTIETIEYHNGDTGSSIAGDIGENCNIPAFSNGFEVTIPGYFNLD